MAGLVAGCIELGLTIIPRGGGTGYTGGAMPLTWSSAVINTEKLEAMSEVERVALPGVAGDGGDDLDRGRRRHPARRRGGRARRPRVRGRSDVGRGVVHRRQHRDERGRQEGGALGHGARQPRVVAHGHARRQVARGDAAQPQPRQDPRRARGRDSSCKYFDASGKKLERTERLEIPGAAFRKEGLGKDVTDKFLAGVPGIQKEGCDGLITSARWIVHKMPAHVRTVCLEFFGNAKDAVPSIVEIRDYLFDLAAEVGAGPARAARRARAPRRPLPEGGRLRDQEQARRPAEDGAVRRHRRRRRRRRRARDERGRAHRQRALRAKASSPSAPRRARSSGSTASARRRSASTPTRSRSTRTSSSRCRGWASTPKASSASTSS